MTLIFMGICLGLNAICDTEIPLVYGDKHCPKAISVDLSKFQNAQFPYEFAFTQTGTFGDGCKKQGWRSEGELSQFFGNTETKTHCSTNRSKKELHGTIRV